jgi:perosamine synthetase
MKDLTTKRAKLGALLTEEIKGVKGISAHGVAGEDQCTYYFYMLRFEPDKMKCDRAQFVKALNAEGVGANAGYIAEPLYRKVVFQKHAFFAGRWPVKEMGLTAMDYGVVNCSEAEAILKTCVTTKITEAMDEDYVRSVAAGIRKVARHYAA